MRPSYHGNDRPRRDEIDEFVVKGLVFQVDVMLLDMLPGSLGDGKVAQWVESVYDTEAFIYNNVFTTSLGISE